MNWKLLIFAALTFITLQVVNHFYQQANYKHPEGLVPPPQFVEHMAFGYHESFADSLWLRTIQDFEECDILQSNPDQYYGQQAYKMPEEIPVLDPKLDETLIQALKNIPKQKRHCGRGWAFTMMDAATNLAPRFRTPYVSGATALSVIMDDYDGAKMMFDKGVKNFPHDWMVLYRAAYHYLFDRKDLKTAADLMNRAAKEGAPAWLQSLAARLYTQSGQAELGLSLLRDYLKDADSEGAKKDIQNRIDVLEQKVKKSKNSP